MNNFLYFLQYISIIFFFLLFKLIGLKFASFISEHILKFFGPLFRSKKIISQNIQRAFPNITFNQKKSYKDRKMKRVFQIAIFTG